MAAKGKPWRELTKQYQSSLVTSFLKLASPHLHDESDFVAMTKHFFASLVREVPVLRSAVESCSDGLSARTLVSSFAALRQERESGKARHQPLFSLNDVDGLLISTGISRDRLSGMGFSLSKHRWAQLRKMATESQETNVAKQANLGGRPSMTHASSTIDLVRTNVSSHLRESANIVVVGRGNHKQMVVASLLTAPRYRIWCQSPELHENMSWQTFRRVLRLHFPHIRNARRDTDVCKHCKHFSDELLPRAVKLVGKVRSVLQQFCSGYFSSYDSSSSTQRLQADKQVVAEIKSFMQYINVRNADSSNDPLRATMTRAQRLSLHTAEAAAAHKLKPHVEILEAYEWHQITASRQTGFVTDLRSAELPANTLLVQMDFKENVKYPMSPKETSEDWHAQNKLSLTVFGANALAPKILVQ